MSKIDIKQSEGLEYLKGVEKNSIDLILTDPPYITSHSTGMDMWVDHVSKRKQDVSTWKTESQFDALKSPDEWDEWLTTGGHNTPKKRTLAMREAKKNFLKYGSIYGAKYAVKTDYGEWDECFEVEELWAFVDEFYRTLKKGGTCIIFFDIWKISFLHQAMMRAGFKQLRLIEWIKTNPQPLNSGVNYLTNAREVAVLGIKNSKPTFNSRYDNGVYRLPLQGGKYRIMPTQKSTALCEELIEKHSNPGDLILDTFMGAGTTAVAAHNTGRNIIGCEMREDMYNQMQTRIEGETGYDFTIPHVEGE
jgi:site-specific DNA-methyltransferase (adenine-specific)